MQSDCKAAVVNVINTLFRTEALLTITIYLKYFVSCSELIFNNYSRYNNYSCIINIIKMYNKNVLRFKKSIFVNFPFFPETESILIFF